MKYFTVELLHEAALNPGVVPRAWERAVDAYWREVEHNRDAFSTGLQELVRAGLHDASIEEVTQDSDSVLLRLGVLGPTPRGEDDETMHVAYRRVRSVAAVGVVLGEPKDMRPLDLSEIVGGYWLYDEVGREDSHSEHKVIVALADEALAIFGVQFADVECTVSIPSQSVKCDL